MASSTMPAGTGANNADAGTIAWTNPGNIVSSNDTRATSTIASGETTQYLHATNFGFSIPSGATIDGIVVSIERSNLNFDTLVDTSVNIIKGGTRGSTNKASGTSWPSSDTAASYGTGTTDLWGETWTDTDINASTFGVALRAQNNGGMGPDDDARVDFIEITVYYTESTPNEATVAKTLQPLTVVASSTLPITGTGGGTFAALAIDCDVSVTDIVGTLAATLAALTSSSTTALNVTGTSTATLGTLTVVGTLEATTNASVVKTLGALTSASSVTLTITGSASPTLGALTVSFPVAISITGSGGGTFGALAETSAASVGITGTLTGTFDALTGASAGTLGVSGSLAGTLAALTSSGTTELSITGTLTKLLGTMGMATAGGPTHQLTGTTAFGALTVSSLSGILTIEATGGGTLGALTSSSSIPVEWTATLSKTLGALASSSAVTSPYQLTLAATLGTLTGTGAANVDNAGTVAKSLGALASTSASTVTGSLESKLWETDGEKCRVFKNDVGINFVDRIKDEDGNIFDISAATTLQFIFRKPGGTTITRTASLFEGGTTGKLSYVSIAGDLDTAGKWIIQTKVILPTGTWFGDLRALTVRPILG